MNNNSTISSGNVIARSHPNSHITILPIDSLDFKNIFKSKISGYTCNSIDYNTPIVILQATVCDNYAVVEYMTEINYYSMLATEGV